MHRVALNDPCFLVVIEILKCDVVVLLHDSHEMYGVHQN